MKKLKLFLKFLIFLLIIFLVLVFLVVRFYSGDEGFKDIVGSWEGSINSKYVRVEIFKGSRAIRGYTYGYFDILDRNGKVISSHKIKYKKNMISETGDVNLEYIKLKLSEDKKNLLGEVKNLISDEGLNISGKCKLKKR